MTWWENKVDTSMIAHLIFSYYFTVSRTIKKHRGKK